MTESCIDGDAQCGGGDDDNVYESAMAMHGNSDHIPTNVVHSKTNSS